MQDREELPPPNQMSSVPSELSNGSPIGEGGENPSFIPAQATFTHHSASQNSQPSSDNIIGILAN